MLRHLLKVLILSGCAAVFLALPLRQVSMVHAKAVEVRVMNSTGGVGFVSGLGNPINGW